MNDRAQLHYLSMDDPERAVSNPALAAMLEQGWDISAHFVAQRADGQVLALILTPPRKRATFDLTRRHVLIALALAFAAGSASALVQTLLGLI